MARKFIYKHRRGLAETWKTWLTTGDNKLENGEIGIIDSDSGDNPNHLRLLVGDGKQHSYEEMPKFAYAQEENNSVVSKGYDYAEYFKWAEDVPAEHRRQGRFVTIAENTRTVRPAQPNDKVLGITSHTASIIGNWEEGSRSAEDGWVIVGMLGIVEVEHDSTCTKDGYAMIGADGIATNANDVFGYKIVNVNDDTGTVEVVLGNDSDMISRIKDDISAIKDILNDLDKHKANKNNPHGVTADQVGTYTKEEIDDKIDNVEVDLTAYAKKSDYNNLYNELSVSNIKHNDHYNHSKNKENPHNITPEQIGTYTIAQIEQAIAAAIANSNGGEGAYVDLTQVYALIDQLEKNVASVSKTIDEHSEDAENPHNVTADQIGVYTKQEIDIALMERGGSKMVSIHDNLEQIVPKDGEIYIVKYENMSYGKNTENPGISDKVFYFLKIGNGKTSLNNLPIVSNIQSGDVDGSLILVDPTFNNGEDGSDAAISTATAQYAVSLGKYIINNGKTSVALNYSNEITENGERSFVANAHNMVDAPLCFIAGYENVSHGSKSTIFGGSNESNGEYIFQAGTGNYAGLNTKQVLQIGNKLKAESSTDQVIIGRYNKEDSDAAVILASGTKNLPYNALTIKKNGKVEIDGNTIDGAKIKEVSELVDSVKEASLNTAVRQDVYIDELGNFAFVPQNGNIIEKDNYNFLLNGYSDVTISNGENYKEFPEDGSNSKRSWACLGTTASKSMSNGNFIQIASGYANINMQYFDEWAAFKIKIIEEGSYSVFSNFVLSGGSIETYILPLTEDILAEFDSNNTETYGVVRGNSGSVRTRSGAKPFSELVSIKGMSPIGRAYNLVDSQGNISSSYVEDKLGGVFATPGEYLLLFRAVGTKDGVYNIFRFKNIKLKQFESLPDYDVATKLSDGLMSAEDKIKLDGVNLNDGQLILQPTKGEGGQIQLQPSVADKTNNGIIIDTANGDFRIIGLESTDGTSKTGYGTVLSIDPYDKTISGGYTFDGNVSPDSHIHPEFADIYRKNEVDNLVSENGYSIGDIKTSIRPSIGDDWVLCDGRGISIEEYPELCSDKNGLGYDVYMDGKDATYGIDAKSIAYHNGECLINRKGQSLLYSNDMEHNVWTEVVVDSSVEHTIYGVSYYNGLWYAFGTSSSYKSGSTTYSVGTIWYTATPSQGEWTKNYCEVKYNDYILDIAFNGDYLVGVGYHSTGSSTYPMICYFNSLGTGNGNRYTINQSGYCFTVVDYCNDTWVAGGQNKNTFTILQPVGKIIIYTSTNPTSSESWIKNTSISETDGVCNDIAVHGNIIAINGGYYADSKSFANILYTTSPADSWESKSLYNQTGYASGGSITHDGTDWVVLHAYQSADKNIRSYLSKFSDLSLEAYYKRDVAGILPYAVNANNAMIRPASIYKDSDVLIVHLMNGSNDSMIVHSKRKQLPTILDNGVNAYIKAK